MGSLVGELLFFLQKLYIIIFKKSYLIYYIEKINTDPGQIMTSLLKRITTYENWQDLKINLIETLPDTKQKSDIFELITKYYLLIDPTYRTKLKEVLSLNEVPTDVREYLNLPINYEGINLIARTIDNEYWVVQCKYLGNEDTAITHEYISTFLDVANNICKNISKKLVCTTADTQSYKFEKLYDDSVTFLLDNIWNSLDNNFFVQLNNILENKTIELTPFKPKEHQERAIKNRMKDLLDTSSDLKYLPFEEARDFTRGLGLKTTREWQIYCIGKNKKLGLKPNNIPRSPEQVYRRDGWINYKDWLKKDRGLRAFDEAKEFVKTLNLQHRDEWQKYCIGKISGLPPKPEDIPRDPDLRHRKDWVNWNDWLTGDSGKIQGEWRDFEEAREFVRSLGLNGSVEWREYCKGNITGLPPKPDDIPVSPDQENCYKHKGWKGYGDWIGTGRKRRSPRNDINEDTTWLPYEQARDFVHSLKLMAIEDWQKYVDGKFENLPIKPDNIPSSAYFVYRDNGWIGWIDWLGYGLNTKSRVKNALPFEEAREFIRNLGLKNTNEWEDYKKGNIKHLEPIPDNIPKAPSSYYKSDGWIGMLDWLGVE